MQESISHVDAGKLVTIKGTVVRASGIKPMITELDFLCLKCSCSTDVRFADGIYAPPAACSADGCRGRSFLPQRSTAKAIDWQKLRLQACSLCISVCYSGSES